MTDKMRDSFEKYLAKGGKDHFDIYASFETWQAATLAERERCASLFDGFPDPKGLGGTVTCKSAADAIRKGE